MTLEKSTGGWKFKKVGEVKYTINGKILQVEIPRSYLGMTGKNISFNFKWCDNNLTNGDIMTLYTDGDAAPGARFAFHFEGSASYVAPTATPLPSIKGDIDCNKNVETRDYILVRKHILSSSKLTGEQLKRADVNGDGAINVLDYVTIRKIILKIN